MKQPERKWVVRKLEDLVIDPKNARSHPVKNRDATRASLDDVGQVESICVEMGTNRVLGGNLRVDLLRESGETDAMCCEVDVHGAAATKLALRLNRTAELAEWDDAALTELLKDLELEGALDGLGWEDGEIESLLGETPGPDAWVVPIGNLPDGPRAPIQQMTFTLHDDQAAAVKVALADAKAQGPFIETGNENSNGNALARICEAFRG